jgi:uncharacterized membrane protein (UPF0127 family)
MYVSRIPDDHGMLFLFSHAHYAAFWMKDTWLSLDLVFVRSDGTVANIAEHAKPRSLDTIQSTDPVSVVIELVAGTAKRIRLSAGDRVIVPALAVGDNAAKRERAE